jgi:hypothetical protein
MKGEVQVPTMPVALAVLAEDEVEIYDCFAHIRELLSRTIMVGATDVFGSWGPHGRQASYHNQAHNIEYVQPAECVTWTTDATLA